MLRLAENIVFPVTGVLGDREPHADSFALDEVGCILLSALREWTRDSPTTAVLSIARSIIRFVENVIPDPDSHKDTAATLETMRDEHLEWATHRAVHERAPVSARHAHRVDSVRGVGEWRRRVLLDLS
ncbi:hypothetical protein [Streptomyces sp. LN549]|uniref:hypothetical protein n=1 Tax=Streptomyces sp. LN549 TaxID=3112979 RepID=UPI003722879B